MSSHVEQIKERLDIADVVESYIKLERAGSNLKARCPFHNEKTPSFIVSPARQTYHCFGCNVGGDIFSFVAEMEGLDFRGALKVLADRAGVEITNVNPAVASEKEKLFAVLEAATRFFEGQLATERKVIVYLKERGVEERTMKMFRLGYAPDDWRTLCGVLGKEGFSETILQKAGLAIGGERGHYDRFRGRIMFPITDSSGRVVGFSGRIFSGQKTETAKYINTPETSLYNKSNILYGFDKAKAAIRREGVCILVEGQMDLVMSHQAGFANTVAVSGTALTEHHLRLIKRLAGDLVFAFDPDEAGVSASRRGVDTALICGMDVKIADLPAGVDPADLILKDKKAWAQKVGKARRVVDFYLVALLRGGYDMHTLGRKIEETVLPLIQRVKRKIDQAHFVSKVAHILHISEERVWEQMHSMPSPEAGKGHDYVREKEEARLVPKVSLSEPERKILGIFFWQEGIRKPLISVKKFKDKYKEIIGEEGGKSVQALKKGEKEELIYEAEQYYEQTEDLEKEVMGLLRYIEGEVLGRKFADMTNELSLAEQKNDTKRSEELFKKINEIAKKIEALKDQP